MLLLDVCISPSVSIIMYYVNFADTEKNNASPSAVAATTTTIATTIPATESISPSSVVPSQTNADLMSDTTVEIEADRKTVKELRELVSDFSIMLTKLLGLLQGCNVNSARFFLNHLFDTDTFTSCDNFEKLLSQLCRGYVDTFNIFYLQKLATCLERDDANQLVKKYDEKKNRFLEETTVHEFQKAVITKAKSALPKGMAEIAIWVPKELATNRILKDIEMLAFEAFEDHQKRLVQFHAFPGSIIISWFVAESLCANLQQLAQEKVAVWREYGVEEVIVGSQQVFLFTNQEPLKEARSC